MGKWTGAGARFCPVTESGSAGPTVHASPGSLEAFRGHLSSAQSLNVDTELPQVLTWLSFNVDTWALA